MPQLTQYMCQNQKYPAIDDCDQAITTPQAAAARRDFSADCRRTDINMSSTRYLLPNPWLEDYWSFDRWNRSILELNLHRATSNWASAAIPPVKRSSSDFCFASRTTGASASTNTTISSPVRVLIS